MGFSNTDEIKKERTWKFNPKNKEDFTYDLFFEQKVIKKDNKYIFDFLNMEYDAEYNELTVKGEDIELNAKIKPKNKDAREIFARLNNTEYKDTQIFKELRTYIKKAKTNTNNSITDKIKYLVEIEKVHRKDNELVQELKELFFQAGLKKTHNRYVMPQENNICKTITKNEMLDFVYNVCDIKMLSSETLDIILTYFNMEIEPSYHKIVTNNGYYDFEKNAFYTSAKEEIIINKVTPYKYDESLIGSDAPPILKKFLEETFRDDLSKINQLLEVFGYYLDDGNPYQLLISFVGPSRSGKSVCVKLLVNLLSDNHSTVDILTIDFNSKYAQELVDSDINVIEEVRGVKNVPEVKNYTGQGGVQIARIYESPRHYDDLQVPKTLITTNNFKGLEKVLDTALIERMRCYIEFLNGINDASKRNPQIDKDIINEPGAMDWLLTNSIYAYMQMKHNNRNFQAEKSIDDFMNMLDQYANPLKYIIQNCFEYNMETWEEMYADPEEWHHLVTTDDVRTCIYQKQPEAKISTNSKIKSLIMAAFDLEDGRYSRYEEDCNGYYEIEHTYDYNRKQQLKFIKGLIRW